MSRQTLPTVKMAPKEVWSVDSVCSKVGKTGLVSILKDMEFARRTCTDNMTVLMERSNSAAHQTKDVTLIKYMSYVNSRHATCIGRCWQPDTIGLIVPFSNGGG